MGHVINPYVAFKGGNDAAREVLSFLLDIEDDINAALSGSLELRNGTKFNKLTAADVRLALFARARARGGVSLCVRNILLEAVLKLEKTSGFAGLIAVLSSIHLIKTKVHALLNNDHHDLVDIDAEISNISSLSRRASKDVAFDSIKTYLRNPLSSSITLQACNITGHNGQIYIDKEYTSSTSIELTNGYTFPLSIENNFSLSTRLKEWKEFNVKVIIIDGIIETVGEINRVLEYFHNEKRPGIIFARGFKDEVLGTLTVNKNRETLNVVPAIVPYDLEGINMLVDLGVVTGADVVSSLKGDVISAINPEDMVTVDKVIATSGSIIISNKSKESNVRRHIRNILEQKNNTAVSDKKDLFDKRTKALSSVCTNIKLNNNIENRDALYLQVQHGINMLKHICRYGTIDSKSAQDKTTDIGLKNMFEILIKNDFQSLSAKELVLGLKTGESLANSILSSSAYLVLDTNEKL